MKSFLISILIWINIWVISCFVTWGFVDISEFSNQGRFMIVLAVLVTWMFAWMFELDWDNTY